MPRNRSAGGQRGTNPNENFAAALAEVSDRLTRLVQDEIELAKTEVTQKAASLARGAAAVAAGAVFGIFAVVFLLLTLAWVFDGIFVSGAGSLWLGFLIVLIILLALTVGAFLFAWRKLKVGPPTPKMAISEGKKIKDTVTAFGAPASIAGLSSDAARAAVAPSEVALAARPAAPSVSLAPAPVEPSRSGAASAPQPTPVSAPQAASAPEPTPAAAQEPTAAPVPEPTAPLASEPTPTLEPEPTSTAAAGDAAPSAPWAAIPSPWATQAPAPSAAPDAGDPTDASGAADRPLGPPAPWVPLGDAAPAPPEPPAPTIPAPERPAWVLDAAPANAGDDHGVDPAPAFLAEPIARPQHEGAEAAAPRQVSGADDQPRLLADEPAPADEQPTFQFERIDPDSVEVSSPNPDAEK